MALDHERHADERVADRRHTVDERPADRNRYRRGVTRGLFTLAAVAAAIFLTWLAAEIFGPGEGTADFWIAMGLIAAAGLVLGLSQLFGGWTKWGVPRISSGVFLFGWIPTAIVTGWILLTMQPDGGWAQGRFESWSDSIGVLGFVDNFSDWLVAVPALVLGLVTAFVFDTAGPRAKIDTYDHDRRTVHDDVRDEDVHDYRREDTGATVVRHRDDDQVATRDNRFETGVTSDPTAEARPTRRETP